MLDDRQVAKAGLLMAGVLVLCRFASLGKVVYVAAVFGAGIAIDAYSLAIVVPAIGASLFVNAVRRAFLTQFPAHRNLSEEEGQLFANQYLTTLLVASVLISTVISVGLYPLWPTLVVGKRPEILVALQQLTVTAAWMVVPMAAVSGLTAIMNARHHFSTPQWTHVIPTVTTVLFVMAWGRSHGALTLMLGLLVGTTIQSIVLLWMVRITGHRPQFRIDLRSKSMIGLWTFSLPFIVLDLLAQGNIYIDRTMASSLAEGKISILYWSFMMQDFISGTLIASMLWVLLPHFSEQVAQGRTDELRKSCSLVLRYGAILMFPITSLLVVCGPPLFERLHLGQLDTQATTALAYCLAAYAFGLFAELTSPALAQALLVLGKLRSLVLIGIFAYFIPNILFNLLLIGPFEEVGLAFSTSIVVWLSLGCHYILLKKTIGMHEEKRTLQVLAGVFLAACLMTGVGFGILAGFKLIDSDWLWIDFLGAVVAGIGSMSVFCLLLLIYPGSEDARLVYRSVREWLTAFLAGTSNDTKIDQ